MKLLLILWFGLVCSLCNSSWTQINQDLNAEAFLYRKNKVKMIRFYEYRTAKRFGKGKLTSCITLDTLGREIEHWSRLKLNFFASADYHVLYEYNENGDLSKEISFVLKNSPPLIITYSYIYNDRQQITYKKKNSLFGDVWKHSYDSLGNKTRTQWYLSGDSLENSFFFVDSFYYTGNQLQLMKRYRPDNSLYFYLTYEYDERGSCLKEIRHENGQITDTWEWAYDEKGNRTHLFHTDHLTAETSSSDTEYTPDGLRTLSEGKRRIVYEYFD